MPDCHRPGGSKSSRTRRRARPPRTIGPAKEPRLHVTTGKAARSSVETRGCSRFLPASAAAILMCFDRSREKRSLWVVQFFGPHAGANPRSSLGRATESRETVLMGKNSRGKSGPSKKRKLTPGSTGDNDQANARAHYTSTARFLNAI